MMRTTIAIILIFGCVCPGFCLRTGTVYSVGNALKKTAAPTNRLTLTDFKKASLRIRYRGQAKDTVYQGIRFAALIASVPGPAARINRVLSSFPPGRLARRLEQILSRSTGGVIINLAGQRYRITTRKRHAGLALPAYVWKGPVLAPARRAARRLARGAGGGSARFGPADLRGVVLSLYYKQGKIRTWRGTAVHPVLASAAGHHTLYYASQTLIARALQNLANHAGVAMLHVPGHPPVRIPAAAPALARLKKERDRLRTADEITTILTRLASQRRHRKGKRRLTPDQILKSKVINQEDFALIAQQLFRSNNMIAEILVVQPPHKVSRRLITLCAYKKKKNSLWFFVRLRQKGATLFVEKGKQGAPHYSQLPAYIYEESVRFIKIDTGYWRLGKKDPVLLQKKMQNWALSSRF